MGLPKFKSLKKYLEYQPRRSYKPEIHKKGWGYEYWIANNPLYCGKILVLFKDKKCSIHFHVEKDETFYVSKGKIILNIIYKDGKKKSFTMKVGDTFHITPGLMHQFVGIDDESHIIEFSTEHFEKDSYRVKRGN